MLHLPDTDLTETRFYREAFAEGEVRGKCEGEFALVLRLLHRRLGAASARYETRIRALSLDHLEILGEDLLDFRTEGDLADWLERHTV